MGKWVNFSVCGFYILLFLMIWLVQTVSNHKQHAGENNQTSMFVYFMKTWFFKQKPWEIPESRKLTIFDFSYLTMGFVQFIVLMMNLFVAKENLMIFTQEACDMGFSEVVNQQRRSLGQVSADDFKSTT